MAQVAKSCPSTIVIGHLVGPIIVEKWISLPSVKAFIHAGLPGQESGNALVDVLFGKVNPSGRLPFTWAKKASDYPASVVYTAASATSIPQIEYSEGLFIDYRHFDKKAIAPRFPFGYGLSYTTFAYSSLSVKCSFGKRSQVYFGGSDAALWANAVSVSFRVKNTGKLAGHEVAQVYIGSPDKGEPIRQLKGFKRVLIAAGKTASVSISLTTKDLSVWDVKRQKWAVPSGKFKIYVGSSSRDLHLSGTFIA